MDACNQEYEGDQQCAYEVHISNNIIRKESQSPIREVLARSCWRAGPGQEASDGSKVRREGKVGPFIPCEVRAQTEPARATAPTVACRRRQATTTVGTQAKAYLLGRRRLRTGGNACARATTPAPVRRRVPCGRDVFSQTPQTSVLRRQRLRSRDKACVRATTSAPVQRRLPHGRGDFSQTPQTSTLGRRRLRPGDNACIRATTSTLA